ncbi:alpha-L-fucosidase [Mariniflexile litorale]|uniref:alpha-L-fucosidase n=1 Tax=Mariniflexile litorale TaxID=3045158 RepID=A0AAU7EL49_9FLAO|nr:alpha-L-fucosidase [Mariniflexile sp. KMM 9835]MDQ8213245.1 alpha-L-fucosidase [Mariniflexile sp. KMM 9835]
MIKKLLLSLLLTTQSVILIAQSEYQGNWESLSKHKSVPDWMRDAKFGIYCHWGVYAVPAYNNEHYIKAMRDTSNYSKLGTHKRHEAVYGSLDKFDYHNFIPMFKGENFNAEEWADLFIKGGARFAGLVGEHHDGFAMWDSELTPFNSKDMGPKRDIVGELGKTIKERDLKFFVSLHHELNYTNFKMSPEFAGFDAKYQKLYGSTMPEDEWQRMWRDKCIEVINKYQPDIIYHDAWLERVNQDYLKSYMAYYFNDAAKSGKEVIVTYKGEDIKGGGMLDHENNNPDKISEVPFLSDYSIGTGFSFSWGYTEGMKLRTAEEIIHHLIEIVSCNGQMLLNLSPKADGTFPEDQKIIVNEVGRWLWTFGEAIYETRPYHVPFENLSKEDRVYFTQTKDAVFAITTKWPDAEIKNGVLSFKLKELSKSKLQKKVTSVELFGLKKIEGCTFKHTEEGLTISVKSNVRLPSDIAQVFKIYVE